MVVALFLGQFYFSVFIQQLPIAAEGEKTAFQPKITIFAKHRVDTSDGLHKKSLTQISKARFFLHQASNNPIILYLIAIPVKKCNV